MIVPDLPTYNTIVSACGCCTLPQCSNMETICESVAATRFGSESDYEDDLAVWTAVKNRHDTWEIEHAAFPAAHGAWVIVQAAWVACRALIPCVECGTAPVEPVDPPEPPIEGTMPTMPSGYGDSLHGLWAPFTEPAVALDEIVPTLYRTLTESEAFSVDGDSWWYRGGSSDEFLAHAVHAGIGVSVTKTGNLVDAFDVCAPGYINYGFDDGYYEAGTPAGTITCTATTRIEDNGFTSVSGSALTLQGCGADPWSGDVTTWNVTVTDTLTQTLSDSVTTTSLRTESVDKLPATWPTVDVVGGCVASYTLIWPTKQELYVGSDPGADPPEIGAWTTCEAGARDATGSGPTLVQANVTKVRYKVGVPLTHQAHRLWIDTHAAWVIEHARWVACGSEEGSEPPEPPEPQIFTYFAAQWDWVFYPPEWEAWEVLYLAWVAATYAHDVIWQNEKDEWDACELLTPGDCGTEPIEPTVPPDPSADQPVLADRPVFIAENLFWEWTGGETLATQYSDWQTAIDPPDSPGRVEMVNVQVKCFRDTLHGSPPTFYGRTYNVDDYPA